LIGWGGGGHHHTGHKGCAGLVERAHPVPRRVRFEVLTAADARHCRTVEEKAGRDARYPAERESGRGGDDVPPHAGSAPGYPGLDGTALEMPNPP